MSPMTEEEIRERLTPTRTPEPPANLLARLQTEIPEDLGLSGEGLEQTPSGEPTSGGHRRPPASWSPAPWQGWALAAGLAAMVVAATWVRLDRDPFSEREVVLEGRDGVSPAETRSAETLPPETPPAETPPAENVPAPAGREDSPVDPLVEAKPAPPPAGEAPALDEVLMPAPAEPEPSSAQEGETSADTARGLRALRAEASPGGRKEDDRELRAQVQQRREEIKQQLPRLRQLDLRTDRPGAPAAPERQAGVPKPRAKKVPIPDPSPETPAPAAVPAIAPSTGGSAEPNDAPYGDVFFKGYGVNPFVDTEDDPLSTFGLDVDTGSYTVVRRYLRDGHLPPPEAVRVEEMLNYLDYGDPPPAEGDFAIHAEGAPSPFGEGERYYLLRLHLKGREVSSAERKPARLTFVVDVSGSMAREDRLGLVRRALLLLVDQLRPDDRVALVIYGSRGEVVLEPTADRGALRRALDGLQTGGSTNAEEGLRLGYEMAARQLEKGTLNRVILCSDGVANVGRTGPESILEEVRRQARQGVELTTVGFGMGNFNDVLMEQLADRGNGRYAYVDSLDEARRIFVESLTGTLQTIAAEARAQVAFDPRLVTRYRLLGYENRDVADERFRDDTVDAGEIGAGHAVTALYELKLRRPPRAGEEVATLHLRYASMARGEMVELSRRVTGRDFAPTWERASARLQLTSLVAELAEILRESYWARGGDADEVFRRAQRVSASFEGNHEVADFVSLAAQVARLKQK